MNKSSNKKCCNPHQIVSDFYEKILGYVIKQVNEENEAKDITQEVMGRLIDAYQKQTPINNVRAWLFQVTRNIITDKYRKKDVLHQADDFEETDFIDEEESSIGPEDFILPMIKLLPEEYSKPLYLSDIKRMKQADIAKDLKLSVSATKMRCQRGRKKLHELFLHCCDIEYGADGSFANCTIKQSCDVLLKEGDKLIG